MNKIEILSKTEMRGGFEFSVDVDGSEFEVKVDNDYYRKIFISKGSIENFIIISFKFLLEREPKESILNKFNLKIISKYFPEYEEAIINR